MSDRGEAAALDILLADPGRTGVFTDFDGTLAPIVDDPEQARPLDGAAATLAVLGRTMARVGVVSGRPAGFLLRHLGVDNVRLWGQHGLEAVVNGEVVARPDVEPWRDVVAEAVAAARRDLPEGDVEDKTFTLTLHLRRRPEAAPLVRAWAEACAAATGLVVHTARMSYELRPPIRHGKDVTVEAAAQGLAAACFIGDDAGDAVAFDALDRLAPMAAVRIAVASDESPEELLARADLVVDGPAGALAFLQQLAARS